MNTLFYFHESDVFPYQPINLIWMVIFISLSFIFFITIDHSTKSASRKPIAKDHREDWLRQNTLLSFIHSSICSVLIIIAVLRAPEMFEDPLSHVNYFNYALISFSVGYFFWDFFDCLQNSTSSTFAILIHHSIVITFFLHILLRTRNIGYGLYALSLEINSVFLHARRLLRWYSLFSPSSFNQQQTLKFYIDIGNYITFIVFRFGVVTVGLHRLYEQHYRLDPIIFVFTGLCVAAIGVLNVVLFYRLIRNQINRTAKRKKDSVLIDDHFLMIDNHVILPT